MLSSNFICKKASISIKISNILISINNYNLYTFLIHNLKEKIRKKRMNRCHYKSRNIVKEKRSYTLVTLGWSSLCHTATSWVKAALSEATSASVLWPSSPQSRSLTENAKGTYKMIYEIYILHRPKKRCCKKEPIKHKVGKKHNIWANYINRNINHK